MSFAVRMLGITKNFGAVAALDHVDLEVSAGIIHAVVGENGAGKTTLMRILYGALQADEGRLEVEGKEVRFGSSREAIQAGVGMVSQHYGIIPELTCLQNLTLGAETGPILRNTAAAQRAESLAARMGFKFDWFSEASGLSPAGAQKLEILKLLWREARIMILDEPTAMLSPADANALFESLDRLAADGATIILVTHRLPEVLEHCTRVTVLRGGKRIAEKAVKDTSGKELAQLIVGGALAESAPHMPNAESTSGTGNLRSCPCQGHRGAKMAPQRGVLEGESRRDPWYRWRGWERSAQELFQAIAGLLKPINGHISLDGAESSMATVAR